MKKLLTLAVAFAMVAAFGQGGVGVAFANSHDGKAAHGKKDKHTKKEGHKAEEHKEAGAEHNAETH
jgi:hypothetical protein